MYRDVQGQPDKYIYIYMTGSAKAKISWERFDVVDGCGVSRQLGIGQHRFRRNCLSLADSVLQDIDDIDFQKIVRPADKSRNINSYSIDSYP